MNFDMKSLKTLKFIFFPSVNLTALRRSMSKIKNEKLKIEVKREAEFVRKGFFNES